MIVDEVLGWLTSAEQWTGGSGIPVRLFEHVAISAAALLLAAVLALPLGLAIGHSGRFAGLAVSAANVGRALPSLALIGIVLPLTAAIDPQLGFKVYPTLVALVVLATPPILLNAYAGVAGVDHELVEAARAMGMGEGRVLARVEVPVGLPVIMGGVRSAAVLVVATATLGAIFGSGGLGRYLVEGIAQRDDGMIFGGVVLVAGLTLLTEALFAVIQRALTSPGLRGMGPAFTEQAR